MFPFGGILSGVNDTLLVPGQDIPATYYKNTSGVVVHSGLRFNPSGILQARGPDPTTYNSALTNSWIHPDAHPGLTDGLYEARFIYQSGDGLGVLQGSAENTWVVIGPGFPEWYVTAPGDFDDTQVQGLIQVREVADTGNIRTGDVTIRAFNEGP